MFSGKNLHADRNVVTYQRYLANILYAQQLKFILENVLLREKL